MRRTLRAGDGTRPRISQSISPAFWGPKRVRLSATAGLAPPPFRSAHAHVLAEKALDVHVCRIVDLLGRFCLRCEFSDGVINSPFTRAYPEASGG